MIIEPSSNTLTWLLALPSPKACLIPLQALSPRSKPNHSLCWEENDRKKYNDHLDLLVGDPKPAICAPISICKDEMR